MTQGTLYVCVPEPSEFDPARTAPTDAETLRDRLAELIGETLEISGAGHRAGTAKVTATFARENAKLDARVADFTRIGDDPMAEQMVRDALAESSATLGSYAVAAVFSISDLMAAESLVWDAAWQAGLQNSFALQFVQDEGAAAMPAASDSIEICYAIDDIPEGYGHPLDFRNAAMGHVERALEAEGVGQWSGAEIGQGEVTFGFEVTDFERAEEIVRAALHDTPYACVREITRRRCSEGMVAAG